MPARRGARWRSKRSLRVAQFDFYATRFGLNLSDQEKSDLVAFLCAL
jgi:hypothetical protein